MTRHSTIVAMMSKHPSGYWYLSSDYFHSNMRKVVYVQSYFLYGFSELECHILLHVSFLDYNESKTIHSLLFQMPCKFNNPHPPS